jgi:hypothetical protein
MIETPKTLWNPAATTRSQSVGRTTAETRRSVWCANFTTSRLDTATRPRSAWIGAIVATSPSGLAATVALVETERVEDVPGVVEAVEWRPLDHPVARREQERLPELAIPGARGLATRKKVGSVKVGPEPEGVLAHPGCKLVYVTSEVAHILARRRRPTRPGAAPAQNSHWKLTITLSSNSFLTVTATGTPPRRVEPVQV